MEFQELRMQWEIITTRSYFTGSNFKPLWYAEPRTQHATEDRNQRGILGTFLTIHLHLPTQCLYFVEEFFILLRKVLRMVTWCKRACQCQFSFCYLEDIQFEKFESSVFAETSTRKPVARSGEQRRDTTVNF